MGKLTGIWHMLNFSPWHHIWFVDSCLSCIFQPFTVSADSLVVEYSGQVISCNISTEMLVKICYLFYSSLPKLFHSILLACAIFPGSGNDFCRREKKPLAISLRLRAKKPRAPRSIMKCWGILCRALAQCCLLSGAFSHRDDFLYVR